MHCQGKGEVSILMNSEGDGGALAGVESLSLGIGGGELCKLRPGSPLTPDDQGLKGSLNGYVEYHS